MERVEGVWRSRGYGWLLAATETEFARYDVTRISCIEVERGTLGEFARGRDRIERANDVLSFHHQREITRYDFTPATFPQAQVDAARDRAALPHYNFDVLEHYFEDSYAGFEQRGIDWKGLCRGFRRQIGVGARDEHLFDILSALLAELGDSHVSLEGSGRAMPRARNTKLKERLAKQLDVPLWYSDRRPVLEALHRVRSTLLLPNTEKSACNHLLTWGRLSKRIGYLAVAGLYGFADRRAAREATGLPEDRVSCARFLEQDAATLEHALDQALRDLEGARALLVDLRLNLGGFDVLAFDIAARFADRERIAFTKCAHSENDEALPQEVYVRPGGRVRFTGPVQVLTSRLTMSAGEILVLAMMALPHVTVAGEHTLGILSDDVSKRLPNGWRVSLSPELYRAPNGACYEGDGIPPDVEIPIYHNQDLLNGFREETEAAMALLSTRHGEVG